MDLLKESNSTIRDAMWALGRSTAFGIVCIADDLGKIVGVVTDGDLRRALLAGSTLDDELAPSVQRNFISVSPRMGRSEVLDLMRSRLILQVPILDESKNLVGVHTYHELLGNRKRGNWAVIMAGGKGTRLGSVTQSIPKPMVKVAGRPILERIILHLVGFGVEKIFISVNHLADVIENHFGDGRRFGCDIDYLKEEMPMGSGGALSLLPELPEHPLLLMNGDLVTDLDVSAMLEYHKKNNFHATVAVSDYCHQVPYGCIETSSNGRLTAMREKPVIDKKINAGIYVLSPEAVASVPADTFFPITNLFEKALADNKPCGVYDAGSDWIDVGTPEELERARGAA